MQLLEPLNFAFIPHKQPKFGINSSKVKTKSDKILKFSLRTISAKPLSVIPENAQLIYFGPRWRYYRHKSIWLCQYKKIAFYKVNLKKKTIIGLLDSRNTPDAETFLELLSPLFELLRREGLYGIHCGAVGLAEKGPKSDYRKPCAKGIIFPGKAGAGKSTLVLHLVANGFKFLSDDRCLLTRYKSGFVAYALREKVKICPANVAGIPELRFLDSGKKGPKKSFDIAEVYPDAIIDRAEIKMVIFPHWQPQEKSRLTSITASEALKEILPLSVEAFFPDSTKANFEFLSDLVTSLPCYKFYLGSDRENWHQIIKGLVQ